MHLLKLKIWNFRKYSTSNKQAISKDNPGIIVEFKNGLNLLVGENDSGKTAIVDAIKFVLGTQSFDYIRIDEDDFHKGTDKLKIECTFLLAANEAGQFLEWSTIEDVCGVNSYILRIWLYSEIRGHRIISDIRSGQDEFGLLLDGEARDLLRVTYLKPLRDAELELQCGNRSRLANILRNHPLLKRPKKDDGTEDFHELENKITQVNKEIEEYFHQETGTAKEILLTINKLTLKKFHSQRLGKNKQSNINISGKDLIDILKTLNLNYDDKKSGLGAQNLLFIATELLLLNQKQNGLRLCLIEEIEAHLHVQAQMRLIEYLNQQTDRQFILTTHSISLASKISLDKVSICKDNEVYPMWADKTRLDESDYDFLKKFLDDTKANLFFAEGVIIVEGIAELIIIPVIAEKIGLPLHEYGISIVNVGSKALARFAKIFMRTDNKELKINVACITDLDLKQTIRTKKSAIVTTKKGKFLDAEVGKLQNAFNQTPVKVFHSPLWTMEYDIACSITFIKLMWLSIRLARLTRSREKNNLFNPISLKDIELHKEKATDNIIEWMQEFDNNLNRVAFEIYKPLENNTASKAVTAFYFSKFLENQVSQEILENDAQIRYIIDAIKYVC